jgi:hypothetical protein
MKIKDYLSKVYGRRDNFQILFYDINYEIDPDKWIFRSNQKITMKYQSNEPFESIEGILEGHLVIDSISIKEKKNNRTVENSWEKINFEDNYGRRPNLEGICLQLIIIKLQETVEAEMEIELEISFHLPEREMQEKRQGNMWTLIINSKICYSVEPYSGHYFCVTPARIAAPFEINIKYPEKFKSCIPGNFESSRKINDHIVEHYSCQDPNVPAFAVGYYKRFVKEKGGYGIEISLYPHLEIDENLFDYLFKIVELYVDVFGPVNTKIYRLGTVGDYNNSQRGGENKGNTVYFTDLSIKQLMEDSSLQTNFLAMMAHEIYHNWNLFSLNFTGELTEFFGEGGANFISSWALEKILGEEASIPVRKGYAEAYITTKGFDSKSSLLGASKIMGAETRSLIYNYGAFVWEQLRQKIGEESLISGLSNLYRDFKYKSCTHEELFDYIQNETDVQIKQYMNQWINLVPKIDLSLINVKSVKEGEMFKTKVEIEVESEKDYELYSEFGYKTEENSELQLIHIQLDKKGSHTFFFESEQQPIFIQIDPGFRIPQIRLDNCEWVINTY